MKKFVVINGILRAPAYIGNVYYMGGDKISMEVLVSDKKNFAPEVVELSEESAKLIADTMKELAKEVKAAKAAPSKAPAKAPAAKPAAKAADAKPAGEIPLV
jgi:hypothetical protein